MSIGFTYHKTLYTCETKTAVVHFVMVNVRYQGLVNSGGREVCYLHSNQLNPITLNSKGELMTYLTNEEPDISLSTGSFLDIFGAIGETTGED